MYESSMKVPERKAGKTVPRVLFKKKKKKENKQDGIKFA